MARTPTPTRAALQSSTTHTSTITKETDHSPKYRFTTHYALIAGYEGRHRWDLTAQWIPKEENKLVRRLDWKICSFTCLMLFALGLGQPRLQPYVH